MNRHLEKLNLLGVIILAVLCVAQWRINRDANVQLQSALKQNHEQSKKIADQQKTIQATGADLEFFRTQLTAAKSSEKSLEKKLTDSERTTLQLTDETAALKTAITNWAAAVDTRDHQLRQAATNIQNLVQSRDDAIEKYNALAKRQNDLVAEINRSRTNTISKTN
jgi:chromosome segregation ATPase